MSVDRTGRHRRSIRLPAYDYSQGGACFVTICAQHRRCLFGAVVRHQVSLTPCGSIAKDTWQWLSQQYEYVTLDEWIVMPNHVHGIIVMDDDWRGGSRTAPTSRKTLGRLIGAFKTVSTKAINAVLRTPGTIVWQRNYYERIIRNAEELSQIRKYVADNPLQWALDRENPDAVGLAGGSSLGGPSHATGTDDAESIFGGVRP